MTYSHVHSYNKIAYQMIGFIDLFKPHCQDISTLEELRAVLLERHRWVEAHDLFSKIRSKTLAKSRNRIVGQYAFEEICAKTIYNLTDERDRANAGTLPPFDEDAPYWVLPFALRLAKELGIEAAKIQDVVLANPE
jgi:hypothetical protein